MTTLEKKLRALSSGKETIIIPVHNGKIKKVYASKLAKLLESINDKE